MIGIAALALSVPLYFEANRGQTGPDGRYVAVAHGYTVLLSDTGIKIQQLAGEEVEMILPRTVAVAEDRLRGISNYYPPSGPAQADIPHFGRIHYRSVFPGIDLVVYGSQSGVEYDWLVSPDVDPGLIRFSFRGSSRPRLTADGDLILETGAGQIRHRRPSIYQTTNGKRVPITGGYQIDRAGEIRFRVGRYDRRHALTIDPQIVFGTGFGGRGKLVPPNGWVDDVGTSIAVDRAGNVYIGGISYSGDIAQVNGLGVTGTAFAAKLSPDGKTLLYLTIVGGSDPYATPLGSLTADPAGNVYMALAGAQLVKLDTNGHLLASVHLGGSGLDEGTAVALGPDGSLYVTGTTQSTDFPTTANAYRTTAPIASTNGVQANNVFLVKLNPAALSGTQLPASAIIYSTYLGPADGPVVAADASGNAYVAASTTFSHAWDTTPGAFQQQCPENFSTNQLCASVVLVKVNPSGSKLSYGTYYGALTEYVPGSGTVGASYAGGIAVDFSGSAYVSGVTSSNQLPTTTGAFQTSTQIGGAFVAKFSPDGSKLSYATYLSGGGLGIAIDSGGNAYVGGYGGLPIRNGIQMGAATWLCSVFTVSGVQPVGATYCGGAGTLAVLNASGSDLLWSTYVGSGSVYAIALDPPGNVYATGSDTLLFVDARSYSGPGKKSVGVIKIATGQPSGLQFSPTGLTNAASFHSGLPGPGGLASLFVHGFKINGIIQATSVPLPTEMAGISIVVDGTSAPILAVAALGAANGVDTEQINFQVPFEVSVTDTMHVLEVRYGGASTFVSPAIVGPGIFVLSDGAPAIQHASDYSLVNPSNPVTKGETIIIYATGLGQVQGGPPTGAPASGPAPLSPCQGDQPIVGIPDPENPPKPIGDVLYAGLVPGTVGLYQLNVHTSTGLGSGLVDLEIYYHQCWPWTGFPLTTCPVTPWRIEDGQPEDPITPPPPSSGSEPSSWPCPSAPGCAASYPSDARCPQTVGPTMKMFSCR
ncbi:MAG TPA: SBBP repeat-containing protein [Bryobacteraceae bacterium]|nr:SBBP repeat-containing protein [Bryobacteraceae bacterium]